MQNYIIRVYTGTYMVIHGAEAILTKEECAQTRYDPVFSIDPIWIDRQRVLLEQEVKENPGVITGSEDPGYLLSNRREIAKHYRYVARLKLLNEIMDYHVATTVRSILED